MKVTVYRIDKKEGQLSGEFAYFKFTTKRLRNAFLWFLNLLGLKVVGLKEYVPLETLELDDIVQAVYANTIILEQIIGRQARYLIIGWDIQKMLGLRLQMGATQFPDDFKSQNFVAGRFQGLKVIFVPYMTGMVVLPDLDQSYGTISTSSKVTTSGIESISDLDLL